MLKAIRLEKINTEKNVHAFYPTRWTVRGETMNAVFNNFNELRKLSNWSLQNLSDTERNFRIRRVYTYMERFLYLFECFELD